MSNNSNTPSKCNKPSFTTPNSKQKEKESKSAGNSNSKSNSAQNKLKSKQGLNIDLNLRNIVERNLPVTREENFGFNTNYKIKRVHLYISVSSATTFNYLNEFVNPISSAKLGQEHIKLKCSYNTFNIQKVNDNYKLKSGDKYLNLPTVHEKYFICIDSHSNQIYAFEMIPNFGILIATRRDIIDPILLTNTIDNSKVKEDYKDLFGDYLNGINIDDWTEGVDSIKITINGFKVNIGQKLEIITEELDGVYKTKEEINLSSYGHTLIYTSHKNNEQAVTQRKPQPQNKGL
jgi:hypothetical protein